MTSRPPAHELDILIGEIAKARKYAHIDPMLVRGILETELKKGRNPKATLKAVKAKLHQITGAYQAAKLDTQAWLDALQNTLDGRENSPALRALCLEAMSSHASTRERLEFLDPFYSTLFTDLPPAPAVVDLACGLNPLALPWMPLPSGYRYWACDIDQGQMDFLNRYFGMLNLNATARLHDLIHGDPAQVPPADVVLLFKTIPCLEQIQTGIGARLLAGLDCQVAFVSFPTRSLGGRQRGMETHYSEQFSQMLPQGYVVRRHEFPNELVFRLERTA